MEGKNQVYYLCSSFLLWNSSRGISALVLIFFLFPPMLKDTLRLSFLPSFYCGEEAWGKRLWILSPFLNWRKRLAEGPKREDWTTSIAYHFYSAMTTDQVRDLWLLFCQIRSCRTKLVFLEAAGFNRLGRGATSLALMEITRDIFT